VPKEPRKKVIHDHHRRGRKQIELSCTIPPAKYGLLITGDQDKGLALSKIMNDIMREEGVAANPFSFTAADVYGSCAKAKSGS
jgi:hypothetical protein